MNGSAPNSNRRASSSVVSDIRVENFSLATGSTKRPTIPKPVPSVRTESNRSLNKKSGRGLNLSDERKEEACSVASPHLPLSYSSIYARLHTYGDSLPKHAGACLVQFARTCPSERSFERSVVLSSPPRGIRRIRSSSLFRVDRSVSVFTRNVVKSGWIFDLFVHSTREDSRILFTKYGLFLDRRGYSA